LLHSIIADGWEVMALGYKGYKTGKYDLDKLSKAISNYDMDWLKYNQLKAENNSCASLYRPNAFINIAPKYYAKEGMGESVDRYRKIINNIKQ
jgi:hypothetical protein